MRRLSRCLPSARSTSCSTTPRKHWTFILACVHLWEEDDPRFGVRAFRLKCANAQIMRLLCRFVHTTGAPFNNEEAQHDRAAAGVGSPQRDTAAAGVSCPQRSHSEDTQVLCSCCLFRLLRLARPVVCYRFGRLQGSWFRRHGRVLIYIHGASADNSFSKRGIWASILGLAPDYVSEGEC